MDEAAVEMLEAVVATLPLLSAALAIFIKELTTLSELSLVTNPREEAIIPFT